MKIRQLESYNLHEDLNANVKSLYFEFVDGDGDDDNGYALSKARVTEDDGDLFTNLRKAICTYDLNEDGETCPEEYIKYIDIYVNDWSAEDDDKEYHRVFHGIDYGFVTNEFSIEDEDTEAGCDYKADTLSIMCDATGMTSKALETAIRFALEQTSYSSFRD